MADRVYPVDRIRSPAVLEAVKQREVAVEIPKDVVYRDAAPLLPTHPARRRRRRRNPCCCCLAWICSMLVAFVIVLVIAAVVIYFVLQPRAPNYSVQDVQLSEFNVTTDSGIRLSSDVVFTIRARNPNKKIGIYYDDVTATLLYEGAQIGQGSINPFYQGHKNTTLVDLELKGANVLLNQDVGSALKTSLSDQSDITLKAHTAVRLRLKVWHWKTHQVKVWVTCTVDMSSPSASGGARLKSHSCKVNL